MVVKVSMMSLMKKLTKNYGEKNLIDWKWGA